MASVSESKSQSKSYSDTYIPEYSETAILQEIAQHARAMSDTVYNWGMDRFNQNQGDIDGLMRDALSYASPQRIAVDMGMAEAGVQQAAERGRQSAIRDLESYGIDPSSGRYAALDSANRVMSAAAAAGAGNQQRMADQAAGNAMRNQALAAGLQNAQFGVGVGDSANRFLGTAMQLKYPPLGRYSTSESTSESHSVTTDPPKSPQGGGGEGGARPPGGGAGRPEPKPKEPDKLRPPPKPPKGGKGGGKGGKGDKPAETEDKPEEGEPFTPQGPDLPQGPIDPLTGLPITPPETPPETPPRDEPLTGPRDEPLTPPREDPTTPREEPLTAPREEPLTPPSERPGARPPPDDAGEPYVPDKDLELPDPPGTGPSWAGPGPYEGNIREAAFTVESNIDPATGEPIDRTAEGDVADPAGGLLTDFSGRELGYGDFYSDIGRGRLATEDEIGGVAAEAPDTGTDASTGPYDSTYDTGDIDAEGIRREEAAGPGLETGYGEEPGYDFAETGEIAPGAAEPEPAPDYGEDPGYDYADQDYGEDPGYDYGEEPTPEAPEEPDYGEDPGYDFQDQDYGDDSYEDYTDEDYSEEDYDEEDYGGDEDYEDYEDSEDSEGSGDYEGESAARGGAVMRGRMRGGIRRARVMPPRTGYQFGGPIPPRRPGQRPRRLAPPPRPPQAPRPARGAPMPMRGGPQPTPMGRAPLMPGNFISANGMPPPAVGGMQRPVQRMAQGGQAGRRAEPTQGGFVSRELSPSGGSKTDDVNARLNAGEFVVPRDVTSWLGKAHFYKLIANARKMRAEAGNGGINNGSNGNRGRTGYGANRNSY